MFSRLSILTKGKVAVKSSVPPSSTSSANSTSTTSTTTTTLFSTSSSSSTSRIDSSEKKATETAVEQSSVTSSILSSFRYNQPVLASILFSSSSSSSSSSTRTRTDSEKKNNIQSLLTEINNELVFSSSSSRTSSAFVSELNPIGTDEHDNIHHEACCNTNLSRHYQLLRRIIQYSVSASSSSSTSLPFHLPTIIEMMSRKLILLREQAQLSDFESESYVPELFGILVNGTSSGMNINEGTSTTVSSFSVLKALSFGIVQSELATPDDILVTLTSIRTLINAKDEESGNHQNSSSSSPSSLNLSDNDRVEISKILRLAKQRLEMNLKDLPVLVYPGNSETHENTVVQCFHSLFPLILHGPFSVSAELLMEVVTLFDQKVLKSFAADVAHDEREKCANDDGRENNNTMKKLYCSPQICSAVKQVCYVVSVLARRPSCSSIAKPLLLDVLDVQTRFIVDTCRGVNSSQQFQQQQHLNAASSHTLLAFNVLDEPVKLLTFIDEKQQNQQQTQQHWTSAWALAQTGKVNEAIEVLFTVAKSRPNGWTGVPARIRHVFQSVGSRLETRSQLLKWCQCISEMKCASMRVDYENLVPVLLGVDRITKSNREVLIEIAKLLAETGLFQSSASQIIRHLLSVKSVKTTSSSSSDSTSCILTQKEQEELVCEVVDIWREVVSSSSSSSVSSDSTSLSSSLLSCSACILDSRLLELLIFDHGRNSLSASSSSLPSWAQHIVRNPSLLLKGALPSHTLSTIIDRLENMMTTMMVNKSNQYHHQVVKALHQLSNKLYHHHNINNNNNDNDNDFLVWSCQLCDTSNTYIHSTCGNDACQAARFSPIQCKTCSFVNPAQSKSCVVCSSSFFSSTTTKNGKNDEKSNFILRPFGKWKCSSCGEKERNVPTPAVTSGIRCSKCSQMTGPLVEFIQFETVVGGTEQQQQQQKKSCSSCQGSPSEGDMISSQNPVCTTAASSVSNNNNNNKCDHGTLIPLSQLLASTTAASRRKGYDQERNQGLWNCIQCGEKNQSWRERCAKCVHVTKSYQLMTMLTDEIMEKRTVDNDHHHQKQISSHFLLTSPFSGFWKCQACGTQTNSTRFDSVCSSCSGSMEQNCGEIFSMGTLMMSDPKQHGEQQLAIFRKKLMKKVKLLEGENTSNNENRKSLEEMSTCLICQTKNEELQVSSAILATPNESSKTQLFGSQDVNQRNKNSSEEKNENTKNHHHRHLGDFCTNEKCGSALPLSKLLASQHEELSQAIADAFSSLSSSSLVAPTSYREKQSDEECSLLLHLSSLRHNVKHLLTILTSDDSKLETSSLQKSSVHNSAIRHGTNGLAHRLVRLCADRAITINNILTWANSSISSSSSSSSSSSILEEIIVELQDQSAEIQAELIELKSLSFAIASVSSFRWHVMSDSYTRGSLASAVNILLSFQQQYLHQSKTTDNTSNNNNNNNNLPPKIKYLLKEQHRCRWCLGRHPESMCPQNGDLKHFSPSWTCDECGEVSNDVREGAQRYICKSCLGVRPEVLQLEDDAAWAEVWECPQCKRATPMIEDNCIFCPFIRKDGSSSGMDHQGDDEFIEVEKKSKSSYSDAELFAEDADEDFANSSSAVEGNEELQVTTTLPFFPARCGLCGEVHFEALCPVCSQGDVVKTQIRNAFGVISRVYHSSNNNKNHNNSSTGTTTEKESLSNNNTNKNDDQAKRQSTRSSQHQSSTGNGINEEENTVIATVQPHGTAGRNSLVLVPLSIIPRDKDGNLLTSSSITVGSFVRFDAQRSSVDIRSPSVKKMMMVTSTVEKQQRSSRQGAEEESNGIVKFTHHHHHQSSSSKTSSTSSALCATSITLV